MSLEVAPRGGNFPNAGDHHSDTGSAPEQLWAGAVQLEDGLEVHDAYVDNLDAILRDGWEQLERLQCCDAILLALDAGRRCTLANASGRCGRHGCAKRGKSEGARSGDSDDLLHGPVPPVCSARTWAGDWSGRLGVVQAPNRMSGVLDERRIDRPCTPCQAFVSGLLR